MRSDTYVIMSAFVPALSNNSHIFCCCFRQKIAAPPKKRPKANVRPVIGDALADGNQPEEADTTDGARKVESVNVWPPPMRGTYTMAK